MALAMNRWRGLAKHTVVKQGARGALVLSAETVIRVAPPTQRVVDTTGAGDAFNGGFLTALVMGRTVAECLRLGVAVGTLSTRAAGGLGGLPTSSEAEAFVGRLAVRDREGR
jgi:sugar/nucleoside kinase (ribokinase family)